MADQYAGAYFIDLGDGVYFVHYYVNQISPDCQWNGSFYKFKRDGMMFKVVHSYLRVNGPL